MGLMLTLSVRLQLGETVILPKFIFLFRMSPIDIPSKMINLWHKHLLDFIGTGKKHRIGQKILFQGIKKGSMAVPNLL